MRNPLKKWRKIHSRTLLYKAANPLSPSQPDFLRRIHSYPKLRNAYYAKAGDADGSKKRLQLFVSPFRTGTAHRPDDISEAFTNIFSNAPLVPRTDGIRRLRVGTLTFTPAFSTSRASFSSCLSTVWMTNPGHYFDDEYNGRLYFYTALEVHEVIDRTFSGRSIKSLNLKSVGKNGCFIPRKKTEGTF